MGRAHHTRKLFPGNGPQPGCLHPTQARGRFFPSNFALGSAVGVGRGRPDYRSLGHRDGENRRRWPPGNPHTKSARQDLETNSLTSPHLFLFLNGDLRRHRLKYRDLECNSCFKNTCGETLKMNAKSWLSWLLTIAKGFQPHTACPGFPQPPSPASPNTIGSSGAEGAGDWAGPGEAGDT